MRQHVGHGRVDLMNGSASHRPGVFRVRQGHPRRNPARQRELRPLHRLVPRIRGDLAVSQYRAPPCRVSPAPRARSTASRRSSALQHPLVRTHETAAAQEVTAVCGNNISAEASTTMSAAPTYRSASEHVTGTATAAQAIVGRAPLSHPDGEELQDANQCPGRTSDNAPSTATAHRSGFTEMTPPHRPEPAAVHRPLRPPCGALRRLPAQRSSMRPRRRPLKNVSSSLAPRRGRRAVLRKECATTAGHVPEGRPTRPCC